MTNVNFVKEFQGAYREFVKMAENVTKDIFDHECRCIAFSKIMDDLLEKLFHETHKAEDESEEENHYN